ncbi:23136_t:CDS:2, partial [Racocetra persica]
QEINKKLTIVLDQQEKEAFINKLRTMVCCKTKACLTKIDHKSAFKNFDNIQKLAKVEYNMFLLEMLYAMVRPNKTLRGKEKQYLTHALSERKSNHALSFATVLNVLTFVVNYANCHRLPLP